MALPKAQSPLGVYVSELSRGLASFPSSTESRRIKDDIVSVSEGLVSKLNNKWRMFKGAKLIKAGSMQDELKIGAPDEYDFMIELPAIDESVITFKFEDDASVESATARIRNYDFFGDVFEFQPENIASELASDIKPGDEDYAWYVNYLELTKISHLIEGIVNAVENFIAEYLEEVAMPGWSLHPGHYKADGDFGQGAITPYLLWSGDEFPKLPVSADYTLAVPVSGRNDGGTQRHYILRRGNSDCRLSCALLEQALLSKYRIDSTEKNVIRVAKYIIGNFLPKYYSAATQDMHSSVSSYAIKNVVFHQLNDTANSDWTMDNLGVLVFRLVRSITEHAKQRNLQCYYMPGYNIFQHLKGIDEYAKFQEESEETEEWDLSDTHTNMKRSIEALECLVHLLERSIGGDESTVDQIKDTIEQNRKIAVESLQKKREEHIIEMLYSYVSEGYQADLLLKTNQFISRNNLGEFIVSGHGKTVTLTRDGSVVDLDQIFKEWYGWPLEANISQGEAELLNRNESMTD